jgi:ubiquinone/menaquinone biosynthesis C-methylase UbiE
MSYNPQSFDRFAEDYDFMASLEGQYDYFLENLSQGRSRALDVGCGTGGLALDLSKHYESVLSIDISEPMLAIARYKRSAPNIEYRIMDANGLKLAPEFDLIVSSTTFHHLQDIGTMLNALKSALKPGGRLVVVDVVCKTLKIPKYVIVLGPFRDFFLDCPRYGIRSSIRLLRFHLSRPWLEHLASDTYLSEEGFRDVYGRALPGAKFTRLDNFMGVVWEASSN